MRNWELKASPKSPEANKDRTMAKENIREAAQIKLFGLDKHPKGDRAKEYDASITVDGNKCNGEAKTMKSDLTAVSVTDRLSFKGIDSWNKHRDWWLFSDYASGEIPTRNNRHVLVFRREMQEQCDKWRKQIVRPGTTRMGGNELEELREEIEKYFPADRYGENPRRKKRIDYMLERSSWSKAHFNWSDVSRLGREVKTQADIENAIRKEVEEHGKL